MRIRETQQEAERRSKGDPLRRRKQQQQHDKTEAANSNYVLLPSTFCRLPSAIGGTIRKGRRKGKDQNDVPTYNLGTVYDVSALLPSFLPSFLRCVRF